MFKMAREISRPAPYLGVPRGGAHTGINALHLADGVRPIFRRRPRMILVMRRHSYQLWRAQHFYSQPCENEDLLLRFRFGARIEKRRQPTPPCCGAKANPR